MAKRTPTPRKKVKCPRPFTDTGTLRAGLYCRVSTAEQQSIPAQLEALRQHATARGWEVVAEVTEAASGARYRPKRQELIATAKRRELDVILVWAFDRWGRSTVDLLSTIHDLDAVGVRFVSLQNGFDLTTPSGRLMATLLAGVAEFERAMIQERVRSGMAAARKRGVRLGRPPLSQEVKDRVRLLHYERVPKTQIAKRIGISRQSVYEVLAG